MTATAAILGGIKYASDHNPLPAFFRRFLAAAAQIGRGQLATVDPSTGYAALNDGTVPDQIPVGQGAYAEMSDTSATAGLAEGRFSWRMFSGLPGTGTTTDTFTDADFCKPCYIASENTLGKLSHTGADGTLVNRSLGGLVFGTDKTQNGTPYAWVNPVAWLLARSTLVCDSFRFASHSVTTTAGTSIAEVPIARAGKLHGKVSQVRVARAATATDGDTNYWTITVSKRTSTTPGTAVTLATATTKTTGGIGAMTGFVYYDLTLTTTSADLDILETDTITCTVAAATGSSAAATLIVEVIGKVG